MNKRQIVVYVSGKYSGKTDEEAKLNIQKAKEAGQKLWELGYTAVVPHLNTFGFDNESKCRYNDYVNGDLELLKRCNCLLMLDNWSDSTKARIERLEAIRHAIRTFESIDELDNYFLTVPN